ncbi:hypothetical protein BRD17_06995 [Halobacteriales archaeon SW_7_68_16]|nr:MAG: hypothetical protein BRD17_06995 [Halobacteriales archaeon SW_7_68_16]
MAKYALIELNAEGIDVGNLLGIGNDDGDVDEGVEGDVDEGVEVEDDDGLDVEVENDEAGGGRGKLLVALLALVALGALARRLGGEEPEVEYVDGGDD